MTIKRNTAGYTLASDLLYIIFNIIIWIIAFGLCRLLLLAWNFDLTNGADASSILYSFYLGVRFDLIVIVWLFIPLVFGLLLPSGLRHRAVYRYWMLIVGAIMFLIAVAEMEFYQEFHSRLNTIALQYLSEDAATVFSMVIHGSPVVTILLAWLLICLVTFFSTYKVDKSTRTPAQKTSLYKNYAYRIPVFLLIFIILAIAGRGTLRSGPPLRWGDAFHTENLFVNHLGLNGIYTLSKATVDWKKKESAADWEDFTSNSQAENTVKNMLSLKGDHWLDPVVGLVYRSSKPTSNEPLPIKNVVFIMMESFSGYYVGALGSTDNITPNFDALAQQGLLFNNFFSNGTHTHQGMFASFACFPNLPDYEYLMQQPAGNIEFSGFPAVMRSLGFKNEAYVYNGDFAWDNQEGFFRKQGITHFIGRNDYKNPVFVDPTWGVSDEDMFNRALIEIDNLDNKKDDMPFFAMLQTLSNHLPYALPPSLPVAAVSGHGSRDEHLTAMRYSDWALGKFFEQAKQKPWYNETLFVVFGDHGFGVPEQITDIDLLRFRVPALLIAPGIQQKFGMTNNVTSSQVDLVPTAAGLLGKTFEHACWGRNLLALEENNPGFAVIKPSGSDKTVAIISGDRAVVKAPDRDPQLYSYQLDGVYQSTLLETDASESELYQNLGSYIQTALRAITENRAGQVNHTSSNILLSQDNDSTNHQQILNAQISAGGINSK